MARVDAALRKLDEAMALLEEVERALGVLASRREGGRGVYSVYTSLVRLHSKLVELREELFRLDC